MNLKGTVIILPNSARNVQNTGIVEIRNNAASIGSVSSRFMFANGYFGEKCFFFC